MRTGRGMPVHGARCALAVAVVAIAAAAAGDANAAAAAAAPLAEDEAGSAASAVSIAFPASVPVGGTGLITIGYAAAPADAPQPMPPGADGGAAVVLRIPAGIEVVSPGFEVYPGPVGRGGTAGEFAVFYAKKALPPAAPGAPRSEEIAVRIAGPPPSPPGNIIDVHVSGIGGGPPAGASAVLESDGGASVRFAAPPAPPGGSAPSPDAARPAEAAPARGLSASSGALPSPKSLGAHLAGTLPRGYDAAAWLAEHAAHMPAAYREEVAAAYRALAGASSSPSASTRGASGQSFPSPPLPTISSYVYGTLHARGADGVLRGQAGVAACMYDVGDDNRTLTLLDNLADPSDPRGACTSTDAAGFFEMSVLTLDPTDPGSPVDLRIVFEADAPHSRVAGAGNRTYALHAATAGDLSDPIRGFNVTVPDGHEFRRALWILGAVGEAHARIAAEFGHAAPAADVRWDPASPAASSYNRTSGAMTISSVHGPGSRHGAEAVPATIAHVYAHHVLDGLRSGGGGPAGGGTDCPAHLRIDLPASPDSCAWRSGWAHFAAAVVQESPSLRYHHLPVAVDLEAPAYDVGGRHVYGFVRGADVPGNVAGALWDLYDTANEPGDSVGGAGAAVWNATTGMRGDGPGLSILDFRLAWIAGAGAPPLRGLLALNGIDVPPDAPPVLAVANASLSVPYGTTAYVAVDAVAAVGPAVFDLAPVSVGNGTGLAAPPPSFANLTYRYAGNGTTTAVVALAPNASDVGLHTINVTARTQHGPSAHALIAVNVTDPVAPYFASVPWDIFVEATGPLTPINATALGVSAYDEVDPSPRISHHPAGPLTLGNHYVWWTATDASNNTAAATMYLTVRDSTPPAFNGTANAALAFAPDAQPRAAYAAPNATDLVDGSVGVSCWPRQGSPIPWGLSAVECYASDRSGNYAWTRLWINATRDDSLGGPAISAPSSAVVAGYNRTTHVVVNATAGGPAEIWLAPFSYANRTASPVPAFANVTYQYDGNGTTTATVALFPNASDIGMHTVNVTARTQHGLSNHTLIEVDVVDATPPRFASVPWDVYVEATGNLTAINATDLGVIAHDEIDPRPSVSHSPTGPLTLGGHYVWWTASDTSNNTAYTTMYLTVRDTTPPAFAEAANLTLAFAPGAQPVAAYAVPNATDLVDGYVGVSCRPLPESHIPWGLTTVVCDASDRSGNLARASFWINATRDGGAMSSRPPLLAVANTAVAVEYGRTARVEANATAAGPVEFGLSSLDAANRTVPAPAFANVTYRHDAGSGTTVALIVLAPNASDVGLHLLNVSARAPSGSSAHALIHVNVTDATPPYFASVPWDIATEATGNLTAINATELGVAAYDEADPRPSLTHRPAGPLPLGDHYVRWIATDASGNEASAEMRLFVVDTTPPSLSGVPANTSLALAPGEDPRASYAPPNASDLVDGNVQVRCSPPPGSQLPIGPNLITCEASDRSDNSARASFWINTTREAAAEGGPVSQAPQPRLALSDYVVAVPYNGTASVRANATGVEGNATIGLSLPGANATSADGPAPAFARTEYVAAGDNSTEALIILSPNASDVGMHRINVTAALFGAPQAHAILAVDVTDAVPPRLLAPVNAVLEATSRLTEINATALGVVATDEADASPVLSASPSGSLPLGNHTIRWTATDASNNTATAATYLTIQDTTPPAFGPAPNVTLAFAEGAQPWANYTAPAASDLVDGPDVRVRCLPPPGSPVSWGLTQVVCVALDSSDNAAWARFWLNATDGR